MSSYCRLGFNFRTDWMLHSLSLRYALTRALDIVMLAIIDIDTNLARSVLLLLIKQRLVPGFCANKNLFMDRCGGSADWISCSPRNPLTSHLSPKERPSLTRILYQTAAQCNLARLDFLAIIVLFATISGLLKPCRIKDRIFSSLADQNNLWLSFGVNGIKFDACGIYRSCREGIIRRLRRISCQL